MSDREKLKVVLVVDDESIDQMLCQRVIKRSNLVETTMAFQYPDEALDFLSEPDRPEVDVILLDINMPRMDGFEFLEAAVSKFGKDFTKMVVVMVTTSLNPADKERAQQIDVFKEFVNKPINQDDLERIYELTRQANASK